MPNSSTTPPHQLTAAPRAFACRRLPEASAAEPPRFALRVCEKCAARLNVFFPATCRMGSERPETNHSAGIPSFFQDDPYGIAISCIPSLMDFQLETSPSWGTIMVSSFWVG